MDPAGSAILESTECVLGLVRASPSVNWPHSWVLALPSRGEGSIARAEVEVPCHLLSGEPVAGSSGWPCPAVKDSSGISSECIFEVRDSRTSRT